MGCDIHYVLEQYEEGQWVGIYASDFIAWSYRVPAKERWYQFFTELAGVRGESKTQHEPKGFPDDASLLSKFTFHDDDGHTPSWLTLDEFLSSYERAVKESPSFRWRKEPEEHESSSEKIVGLYDDDKAKRRVVFWFDN